MLPRSGSAATRRDRSSVRGVRLPVVLIALLPLLGCSSDPAPSAAPSPRAASPSTAPAPQVSGLASSVPLPRPSTDATVRLTGDGIDLPDRVVTFGDTYDAVAPDLLRFLGKPTKDTGSIDTFSEYGTCPGKDLRVLEYDGGALRVLFGTLEGQTEMTVYSWALTAESETTPKASALVGDSATFEFAPGTTLAELTAGAGDALEVTEDEMLGTVFTIEDQSSGFFGNVDGGTVSYVQGGTGCGE